MAVDRIESLYHLTPRGWIQGSVGSMWTAHNKTVEPPTDRVETWEPPEENSWFIVWSSPEVSEEDRKALHVKFPHHLDRHA